MISNSHIRLLVLAPLSCSAFLLAQSPPPQGSAAPVVLQKDEGELRVRRPRESVPMVSSEFLIKVSPSTNGSKHLLVGAEEVSPGGVIPKHRHHGEEEILFIQAGSAHVWLGDKEYDAKAGAVVFIPSQTWISLKNTGAENMSLLFVFNEPSFEQMLLCASVPKGQTGSLLSREGVAECYEHGDAELEVVKPGLDRKQ